MRSDTVRVDMPQKQVVATPLPAATASAEAHHIQIVGADQYIDLGFNGPFEFTGEARFQQGNVGIVTDPSDRTVGVRLIEPGAWEVEGRATISAQAALPYPTRIGVRICLQPPYFSPREFDYSQSWSWAWSPLRFRRVEHIAAGNDGTNGRGQAVVTLTTRMWLHATEELPVEVGLDRAMFSSTPGDSVTFPSASPLLRAYWIGPTTHLLPVD